MPSLDRHKTRSARLITLSVATEASRRVTFPGAQLDDSRDLLAGASPDEGAPTFLALFSSRNAEFLVHYYR